MNYMIGREFLAKVNCGFREVFFSKMQCIVWRNRVLERETNIFERSFDLIIINGVLY